MLEYIVFFGLLIAALLAYLFRNKSDEPIIDPITIQREKCESYIERRLFDALILNGYEVTTQVICGPYRIDLVIFGPRIAIECDGKEFHSTPKQKAHDRRKSSYLRRHGWRVYRFSGRQINRDLSKVVSKINKVIAN